jgi:phosphoribosylformylglycinamidine (FGAM) synthase-like enzyme
VVNIPLKHREDFELFGESHGRIVVTVGQSNEVLLEEICKKHKQSFYKIGVVKGDKVKINSSIDCKVGELKRLYETAIEMN